MDENHELIRSFAYSTDTTIGDVRWCIIQTAKEHGISDKTVIDLLAGHYSLSLLEELPVEVQAIVINDLPVKEILAFCSSSKALKQVCEDPRLWRVLLRRDFKTAFDSGWSFDNVDDAKSLYVELSRPTEQMIKHWKEFVSTDERINLHARINTGQGFVRDLYVLYNRNPDNLQRIYKAFMEGAKKFAVKNNNTAALQNAQKFWDGRIQILLQRRIVASYDIKGIKAFVQATLQWLKPDLVMTENLKHLGKEFYVVDAFLQLSYTYLSVYVDLWLWYLSFLGRSENMRYRNRYNAEGKRFCRRLVQMMRDLDNSFDNLQRANLELAIKLAVNFLYDRDLDWCKGHLDRYAEKNAKIAQYWQQR